MMKEKYHINISTGDITQKKRDTNASYTIFATEREVTELRSKLENMHDASMASFVRAHIPIVPYHKDSQNDVYDASLKEVFNLLYTLGDEQAKNHVQSLGVLTDNEGDVQ